MVSSLVELKCVPSIDPWEIAVRFEKRLSAKQRKKLGQFYTAKPIVKYIFDVLEIKKGSRVLDPTCGCGVFLAEAMQRIGKSANIHGIDINNDAVQMTRAILSGIAEKKIGSTIINKNAIVQKKSDADWWNSSGGFDYIVGNPPFVTLTADEYDPSYYEDIITGNTNAASLIVAQSLNQLRPEGTFAFVLPKTMLRVASYEKLRALILENTILRICDLGRCFPDVRGEQIILFVQKKAPAADHEFVLHTPKSLAMSETVLVPQRLLSKSGFLLLSPQHHHLIEKIKSVGKPLALQAHIFRGISSPAKNIGKKGVPILRGKDIQKDTITQSTFVKTQLNNGKAAALLSKKIVVQNIFSTEAGLIAAMDEKGVLTLDTVTNIMTSDKFVYGLLRSNILNYYLIYGIYNNSRLTMHADSTYLGQLPIPSTDEKSKKRMIELVSMLLKKPNDSMILRKIDVLAAKMYGLTEAECVFVNDALRQTLSKKSAARLEQ